MELSRSNGPDTRVPLLVVSCDAYADVWKPFLAIFRKRWPDCPFPVYLGSNHAASDDPGVTSVPVGEDVSWASNVLKMLDRLDSEYVVFFLEDFLFTRPVDTARIVELVEIARENRVGCLRMTRTPPPFDFPPAPIPGLPGVGVVDPRHPYRVTTQVAVWRTETLRRLLVPGFSAWDFELVGTAMSKELTEPFWEVVESAIHYDHGVERGKWKPAGLALCREAGVPVDLAARPAFTEQEYAAHTANFAELLRAYQNRQEAAADFQGGRPLRGARKLLPDLLRKPSVGGWAFLAAGFGGARALEWLERRKVRVRVGQARERYARKTGRGA